MQSFYNFFVKDIKFYKLLSNRFKKNLIYFFIFIIFLLINNVRIERFIIFLGLLSALLLWKILIEFCCYFFLYNKKLKVFIRKHDNIFTYIIIFLLFIQKWKNPLLVFLLYLDKLLFKIIRNLIYIFKIIYKKDLTDDWLEKIFYIYYLVINILLGPIKLFFGFFYTALRTIIDVSFSFFFIMRIIGFLFSIFIFSYLFIFLYNKLGFLNFFFFIYVFLIIINMIIKYIERDFTYLKVSYINVFINTDHLINLRNHSTLIGFFLLTINSYKNSLIEREFINITSSHLKMELEEGFYKYWEFYKRNTWFSTLNAWKEIKKRPSYYLYLNLLAWLNLQPITNAHALNAITNIIYIKYKAIYLKKNLSKDFLEYLNFLHVFFLLRLKLLLFMIWDIDNYVGNHNLNYIICEYDNRLKYYSIKADETIFDFFDTDNFKVENNLNDLIFYDPENNMEFFDRFYILIGCLPYDQNPLETIIYSEPIFKIEKLLENINSLEWYRGWHFFIKKEEEMENSLIENEVKGWITEFLKENKLEWENSLKKETISERNWRLLKEIENLFVK